MKLSLIECALKINNLTKAAKKFHVPRNTAKRWMRKYKNNRSFFGKKIRERKNKKIMKQRK